MKKKEILDIFKLSPNGAKIRIEFNIGSSGTAGAVEGYLDKANNSYVVVFAAGHKPIDLTFADKQINNQTWSYPEDIVDIKNIELL